MAIKVQELKSSVKFIQDVRKELSKIVWPSKADVVVSSIMALVLGALASVFLFSVDQAVIYLLQFILGVS